jgi:predicted HicB family RNase H-like nuclease
MSIAIKQEGNNMAEIVQLSIRIDKDIRQQIKIMALKKDTSVNDLVTEYIIEGLNKDKE